jgi:hypothetical protein
LVKAVDVLRDERKVTMALLELGESMMSRIRTSGGYEPASPIVPFPNQLGVVLEGSRGGQILGAILAPKASSASKRGDAALGGNACAGENGDAIGLL